MYLEFFVTSMSGLPIIETYRVDSDSDSEIRATIAHAAYHMCLDALDHHLATEYAELDRQITAATAAKGKIAQTIVRRHAEIKTRIAKAQAFFNSEVKVLASKDTADIDKELIWSGALSENFELLEEIFSRMFQIKKSFVYHTLQKPEPIPEPVPDLSHMHVDGVVDAIIAPSDLIELNTSHATQIKLSEVAKAQNLKLKTQKLPK